MFKKIMSFLIFILCLTLFGCSFSAEMNDTNQTSGDIESIIDINGSYTSPEDVALYIHTFMELPQNYLTKSEATALGWNSDLRNLWEVTDHMSIGGDIFYNREGYLPNKIDRTYYECDINYSGGNRGAERIVFSNDGLVYYTEDHYASFTLLYGDE
jgi:ribonuclease T1